MAPEIEVALGGRDKVMAFRRYFGRHNDQFHESPSWKDFKESVSAELSARSGAFGSGFALSADIASYFVYVDVDELERRLLVATSADLAVRDLGDLLRAWQHLGVRGLPQGVPPSSTLGNLYLHPVDRALDAWGVEYRRYMDDLWVFTSSFAEARRIQDRLERMLYSDRLGFGGEKLRIRRNETARRELRSADEGIERRREVIRQLILAEFDPYADEEPELDEAEIDETAVHEEYENLMFELDAPRLPSDAKHRLTAVYRALVRGRDPFAITDVPQVLLRMPDLTPEAMRYLAQTRAQDATAAREAFLGVLEPARFHRDQEWVHICRGIQQFRHRPSLSLADRMSEVARTHEHALVRARALLAWGSQSQSDDFTLADDAWLTAEAAWRAYVLVAIQHKQQQSRDARYERWSGEARFLGLLAGAVKKRPFQWRAL
jgi:hypothetical protein